MKAIHYLAVLCFFSLVSGHAIASSEPVDIPVRADSTFIYLIRHAESEENIAARERKKTGAPPLVGGALSHVKLSETGREQAARLGVQLKGATFVRYISSTAERAKSTLQICLDKMGLGAKITPEHMESLEEQSKGSWEGRLVSETYGENNSNIADTWGHIPGITHLPGDIADQSIPTEIKSESPKMVAARMNQTLIDIARADNSRGGHIMVVSHGNAMKFFMHSVFPEKLKFNGNHGTVYNTEDGEQLRIDNTDMIVLTYDHIQEEWSSWERLPANTDQLRLP